MNLPLIEPQQRMSILIVDDEPDIHSITRLSLKSLRPGGEMVRFHSAETGADVVVIMKEHPEIAVILLDVVMENDHAGLDACRAIREFNPLVRILLRTGQPGQAPERETIDEYDIDDYLAKADLTSSRLYTSVRTALRAWHQLVELSRREYYLRMVNECVVDLHAFEPLETSLQRILHTAMILAPCEIAVLWLETEAEEDNPQCIELHSTVSLDRAQAQANAAGRVAEINSGSVVPEFAGPYQDGYLLPLSLHQELGRGWIFLQDAEVDGLAGDMLPLLVAHAANTLYATVALSLGR